MVGHIISATPISCPSNFIPKTSTIKANKIYEHIHPPKVINIFSKLPLLHPPFIIYIFLHLLFYFSSRTYLLLRAIS